MTTPTVSIKKQDGNTGVVRPGADGILAIIAASAAGTKNVAASHNDEDLAKTEFSWGPLTEFAAYDMPVTQKPAVLVRCDTTTPGAYSSIVHSGGGTAVVTAGATAPYDDFDVLIKFVLGATIGVAGATYTYSLNGGEDVSAVLALGTATEIIIPNTNISVEFAAGTVVAGETLAFTTTRPLPTNTDLPAALEALRVTSSAFEAVLIDGHAADTTVALVALWLLDLNKVGKFPTVFMNVRPMNAGETETQYHDAMATLLASAVGLDIVLCADTIDLVSPFRGISQPRPFSLGVAAKAMSVTIGVEPAEIGLGPVQGAKITDARGNPKHHNEEKFPGLDDLRLTTARTVEGFEGVYITNTNLMSPTGSDFVFLPHARTMNRAAAIAWALLTRLLSKGVTKDPKVGPNGERHIAEHAAQLIEQLVNDAIQRELAGAVDDIKFRVSRTDDISSNQGANITAFIDSVALAYIKKFSVFARYVKAITGQ